MTMSPGKRPKCRKRPANCQIRPAKIKTTPPTKSNLAIGFMDAIARSNARRGWFRATRFGFDIRFKAALRLSRLSAAAKKLRHRVDCRELGDYGFIGNVAVGAVMVQVFHVAIAGDVIRMIER